MVAPIQIDSMQSQQSRIAVESQYGILPAVPAWLKLSDLKLVPKAQFETEAVTGSGDEAPSGMILNDDFSNVDVSGRAGYVGVMYPLGSLFGFPIDALVSGTTFDHDWDWDGKTPIIPASYGLHYGLPGRAREVLGFVFNNLNLGISRSGNDFGSGGFGKAMNVTGVTMGGTTNEVQTLTVTGTPTALALSLTFKGRTGALVSAATATAAQIQTLLENLPSIGVGNVVVTGGPLPATPVVITFTRFLGGTDVPTITTTGTTFTGGTAPAANVVATTPGADTAVTLPNIQMSPTTFDIFVDDSWAALGTTKMLAFYSGGFGIGDRWSRAMPVNSTKSSDGIFNPEDQEHTVNLRLGADATHDALLSTIRAGAKKFIRILGSGPLTGDASLRNEFQADFCYQLSGTDGYDSEGGIHVGTWNGRVSRDEVSGKAAKFRVRNRRATL